MNGLRKNRGCHAALLALAGAVLLCFGNSAPVASATGHPRLSVIYEGSGLSVEARGVSISEILQTIGAKIGFAVVDAGVAREPLTISLKNVTLDTVLRELLRPENYVLLYAEDAGASVVTRIEKIVLLNPSTPAHARHKPVMQGTRGYEEIRPIPLEPIVPIDSPQPDPAPMSSPGDMATTPRSSWDEQPVTHGTHGGGSTPPAAGPSTTWRPSPAELPPLGAPDPGGIKEQILERVRTLVDRVRRDTLDVPMSNRNP